MKPDILFKTAIFVLLASGVLAEGNVKTFDEFYCELSLPDDNWAWQDEAQLPHGALAFASSQDGILYMLYAKKAPTGYSINRETMAGFDEGFIVNGITEKTNGKIIAFKGVPCYQLNGRVIRPGKRTCALRFFVAHGFWYQLQVLGTEQPVEDRADMESIFNAFRFTTARAAPSARAHDLRHIPFSRTMGKLAFWCLVLAAVVFLFKKAMRCRSKAAKTS